MEGSGGSDEGAGEDLPLVTVLKVEGAQRIAAVDPAAARAGVKSGSTLADARALCPTLDVVMADPAGEAETLGRLCDWCLRFTPLVALDGPDGLLLDIAGAAHLFGGETAMVGAVERGLGRLGFAARGAVASTPEAAWAWSRFGTGPVAPDGTALTATGGVTATDGLAALPVQALRLDPATVSAMAQAGLRRIGDLALRPRAPLAARFGAEVLARLDGLLGRRKSSISPRVAAPVFVAERRFASGLTRESDLEAALLPLSRHVCTLLSRAGQGARRLEAAFFRVDGAVMRLAVGTGRATRDPDGLAALFRERLAALGEDGLDTGYGFDLVRLGVTAAEPLDPSQDGLVSPAEDERDLTALTDRLGARLGQDRVLRLTEGGSHRPERAAVAVSAILATAAECRTEVAGTGGGGEDAPCRPLRLFDTPEPVTAIAEVPDGPPVRFVWRRVVHEIAASEGPERIAPEWWRAPDSLTRDYFRVEDRDGRRFWLFREGLFGRETAQARWFLHGLFG